MIIPIVVLFWWGNPLELLFTRTVSGLITGGFSTSTRIGNLDQFLQNWPSMMTSLKPESIHISLSLPGWPILYYGVANLLESVPTIARPLGMSLRPFLCNNVPLMNLSNAQLASAWLGIFSPLWAALTVIPLYYLGRVAAEEPVARQSIAWWPLVPSLAMFLGTLNTVTPLIAMTIIYLLYRGLTPEHAGVNWRLMLAGALTAGAIMFTFAFIPLLLFAGILALIIWQQELHRSWLHELRRPLSAGLYYGLGLLIIFAAYVIAAGHTPLEVLRISMGIHLDLERKYWPWLWLHSWDFIIFLGLPAFGLFIMALTRLSRSRIRQLANSLLLTLIIIVLSGTARGETGRLWIFFMPLALLIGADVLVQLPSRLRVGLVVSQALWLLALFMVLPTTGRGYAPPPVFKDVAFLSSEEVVMPTAVDFGGQLQLNGYSAKYDAGENAFVVDLLWQTKQQNAIPYFFSALLLAPDGSILPAVEWQPFDYQYPTTCWPVTKASLTDRISLPLNQNSPAGDYWLSLSVFYITENGEMIRLPATTADGEEDTQGGLGPLIKE